MFYSIIDSTDFLAGYSWCAIFYSLNSPYKIVETVEELAGSRPITATLEDLLKECESFPPAIALAKEELSLRTFKGADELEESVTERLEYYIRFKSAATFVYARSTSDDGVYRSKGKHYWVVRRGHLNQDDVSLSPLWWVSSDYEIYSALAGDFELTRCELDRLPVGKVGL